MIDIQIGKRIRELRKQQNSTREGLAEKAGISAKFLYEIETGKKGFSIDILGKLSRALAVSCDYIVFVEKKTYEKKEQIICVLKSLEEKHSKQEQELKEELYEILNTL